MTITYSSSGTSRKMSAREALERVLELVEEKVDIVESPRKSKLKVELLVERVDLLALATCSR